MPARAPEGEERFSRSRRGFLLMSIALVAFLVAPLFHATAAAASSYVVTREGNTYRATAQGAGSTYTGTLKRVMESAARDLNSAGGGTLTFATGVFDFGSEFFKGENLANITFHGQGMDVTVVQNNSSASADTEPFNMGTATRITVRDMTVIAGGPFRSTSDALDFDGGNEVVIERLKISGSRGRGIVFDGKDIVGGFARSADRNTVRNCVISGIQSDGIELLASRDNRIEGCTITNVGGHGIQITKSSTSADQPNKKSNGNVLTGNSVDNAGQDGINLSSGDRNEIRGNTVLNSSDDTSGRDGIRLSSSDSVNCDDNVVSDNSSGDNQATHTQRYGLNISSSRCNRTVVWQNTFFGNVSGGINDQGTATRYSPPAGTDTQAPTTPGTLSATAVSSSRVDLSWGASTDNVGVTNYEIFRNGSLHTTVGTVTSYSDTTVSPSTTYSYQVRARDAAGNRSGFSNTATATTPSAPDTQAPTTPGTLSATAVSSSRVDLSWGASSDNVGVTGYEIFRNGSLLQSVGAVTSYSDTTVSPSTTYSYQVRARDAAGNRSGFSNTATATTPAGDTEPPSAPGLLAAVALNSNRVELTWTASTDNEAVTAYEIFRDGILLASVEQSTAYSDTTVEPLTTYEYQVRARDAAENRSEFSNAATAATPPAPLDDEPPTTPGTLSATAVSSTRVDLSWGASTDNVGVTGYEIYRNGSLLTSVGTVTTYSDTTVSPSATYSYQVRARDAAGNRSGFSNTATATTPAPPDTQAPTTPGTLSATAVSSTRVDLSWGASSDNVGVTNYDIYRNSSLLTSVGAVTSFSDTTASPSTTYSYQVRARDAAGNPSGLSNTATATTPAASTALFSDGFETGNFSSWTSNTGLVAQQQQVYQGSWAARGTTTSAATWAYKTLGTTHAELYYRIRFKVVSQGASSTMNVLKLRTATGTALFGLFRNTAGSLGYRNEVAAVSTTSSTPVSTGVWHEVQVRVRINGASGATETWLDGVRIAALSKTENFGTTPIGRLQIGENSSGKVYDVAFDNVVANTSFIT
jgi:parallel beta-helix repeat protein